MRSGIRVVNVVLLLFAGLLGFGSAFAQNLSFGPPDPALFTPPANYKVWDRNPEPQAQTTADAKP